MRNIRRLMKAAEKLSPKKVTYRVTLPKEFYGEDNIREKEVDQVPGLAARSFVLGKPK